MISSLSEKNLLNEPGALRRTNSTPVKMPMAIRSNLAVDDIPQFIMPGNGNSLASMSAFIESEVIPFDDEKSTYGNPWGEGSDDRFNGASIESVPFGQTTVMAPGVNYAMHVIGADSQGGIGVQTQKFETSAQGTRVKTPSARVTNLLHPLVAKDPNRTIKTPEIGSKRGGKKTDVLNGRVSANFRVELGGPKSAVGRREMKLRNSLKGAKFSSGNIVRGGRPVSPTPSIGSVGSLGSPDSMDSQGGVRDTQRPKKRCSPKKGNSSPNTMPGNGDHVELELNQASGDFLEPSDDDLSQVTELSFDGAGDPMVPQILDPQVHQDGVAPPYKKILAPMSHRFEVTNKPIENMIDTDGIRTKNLRSRSSARVPPIDYSQYLLNGEQEYKVHNRMMGWKLTTAKRRKMLLKLLDRESINNKNVWGEDDVIEEAAKLEEKKRIEQRMTDAYEQSIRRAIRSRSRTPAGMMQTLKESKPGSISNLFIVDRMKLLGAAQSNPGLSDDFQRALSQFNKTVAFEDERTLHSVPWSLDSMNETNLRLNRPMRGADILEGEITDELPPSRGNGEVEGNLYDPEAAVRINSPTPLVLGSNWESKEEQEDSKSRKYADSIHHLDLKLGSSSIRQKSLSDSVADVSMDIPI